MLQLGLDILVSGDRVERTQVLLIVLCHLYWKDSTLGLANRRNYILTTTLIVLCHLLLLDGVVLDCIRGYFLCSDLYQAFNGLGGTIHQLLLFEGGVWILFALALA